ncbi:MAG: carboxypeptidase regulatory-like domain-containing protein [Gemmatimonadales bacterium]
MRGTFDTTPMPRGRHPVAGEGRVIVRLSSKAPAFGVLVAASIAACSSDASSGASADARDTSAAPARVTAGPGYAASDVTAGGVVRGTIRFTAAPPPPDTVAINQDTATCGASRVVEPVRVGREAGLADAVVSLIGVERGKPWPAAAEPPTLDQHGCRFTPHIAIVQVGQPVRIVNSDPLSHNVHTAAFDNRPVNRTQPAGASPIELRFDAAEKIHLKCDLHPWMSAWIVASEHPYVAVTDETGGFTLAGVPPGTYTLEVWHETLGTRSATVNITAGSAATIDFDLAAGS